MEPRLTFKRCQLRRLHDDLLQITTPGGTVVDPLPRSAATLLAEKIDAIYTAPVPCSIDASQLRVVEEQVANGERYGHFYLGDINLCQGAQSPLRVLEAESLLPLIRTILTNLPK